MPNRPDLRALPALPLDDDGPVFREPWEAQAFAMTLELHQQGRFTWPEWASYLHHEIDKAKQSGDPDLGDTYYHHWLAALENICMDKKITSGRTLAERKDAWDRAARSTPHGEPIELDRAIRRGEFDK
jgi:nitrile hydratase accessory protein